MTKKSNKEKGQHFEKIVQKTINSGAMSFDKGDLKTEDFIIECKFSDKKGFRITQKIAEKLWNESLESNKLPRLVIGFPRNDNELFILNCDLTIQRRT